MPSESFHTVRGLVAKIRRESGEEYAPIGEKLVRAAINRGELAASLEGNRYIIAWSAWLEYQARRAAARKPSPIEPTRRERAERAVQDRLRRERAA